MAEQQLSKLLVILIAAIFAFLIIKPFITAIIFAAVVAYLLYPTHQRLSKRIPENFSLYILTIISATIVILVISFGASLLLTEISKAYLFISKINLQAYVPEISDTIKNLTRILLTKVIEALSNVVTSIPKILLSFFVFFISLFYFLKDGPKIAEWAWETIPLSEEKRDIIFKDMQRYTSAFVHVWLFIGLLQGIIAAVGFYIFGLSYVFLAGIIAALLSILPIIGPYAFYIPIGLLLILSGNFNVGAGLLAYGLIIGSVLDYVVRPYLTGRKAGAHPLLVLIGVLGGIVLIGPAGIIVGPLILLGAAAIFKGVNLSLFK